MRQGGGTAADEYTSTETMRSDTPMWLGRGICVVAPQRGEDAG